MDWHLVSSDYHRNLPLARFDSVNFMGFDGLLHLGYPQKEIELYLGQEVRSFHSMNFIVDIKILMAEESFLDIYFLVLAIHFN
jgi:hypothetical protein